MRAKQRGPDATAKKDNLLSPPFPAPYVRGIPPPSCTHSMIHWRRVGRETYALLLPHPRTLP